MDHNYELVAATFAKRFRSGIEISYISEKKDSSKSRSGIQKERLMKFIRLRAEKLIFSKMITLPKETIYVSLNFEL